MSDAQNHTGFEAPDPTHLAPHFPGYDITGLIACGGMGAVYHAVQRSLDRDVAIKILPREFSKDAAFCAGFESEAKAMARLNHPNLIGVYDFGEVNGMLFIIMEFVPGKSLYHSSNGRAIDPSEVIRIISGVCHGLAHAHQNGIIHRDIKPANILLDLNAEPKIGDFGLARPVDRKIEDNEEIFGTPDYTAPEVVNSPQSVDARADIFSLGVMLHELLTGQLPSKDPRPASAIAQCDPRFDAIVRRATHPSPEARYSSAEEIASDLAKIATSAGPRILQTVAASRSRAPISRQIRPTAKQSSGSPVPLILILIVAIVGAVVYLANKKSAPPARVPVTQDNEPLAPDTTQTPVKPPVADPPLPIYVELEDRDGTEHPDQTGGDEDRDTVKEDDEDIDGVQHWQQAKSVWRDGSDTEIGYEVISGDIGESEDSGVFKYEQWSGDGVFTIRMADFAPPVASAKAGLMIRETLGDDSRHVFLARRGQQEIIPIYRTQTAGTTVTGEIIPQKWPYLRLTRIDDFIIAGISENGDKWINIAMITLVDLKTDIQVGFAACSATRNVTDPLKGSFDPIDIGTDIKPVADVDAFFESARKIMRDRAKTDIDGHQEKLLANIKSLESEWSKLIRKITSERNDFFESDLRRRAERHVARYIGRWIEDKRLEDEIPERMSLLDGAETAFDDHLKKQKDIDAELENAMAAHAGIYVIGLTKQIERYVAAFDLPAARILEKEINLTKEEPSHFRDLMLETR